MIAAAKTGGTMQTDKERDILVAVCSLLWECASDEAKRRIRERIEERRLFCGPPGKLGQDLSCNFG